MVLALAFAPLWALADPSVAVAPPASAQASAGVLQSGYYLEHGNCCSGVTLDGSHVFIDVFTIANRTGGGTSWQSPDLHISTGIEHGGPPVTAPHS
jgi:hypothetical protein